MDRISNNNRAQRRVRWARALIFTEGNPIFRRKIATMQILRSEFEEFKQNLVGVVGG